MDPEKRYDVFVSESAQKELKKLGRSVAAEILRQVAKKLKTRPAEYGDPLHGKLVGYYKLRVSGFRVIYRIVEDRVWVLVLAVGKRTEGNVDNVYDWLTSDLLSERMESLIEKIEEERRKKSE